MKKLGIISVVIHCHRCRCRRHFCNVRLEPGDREFDLAHARKAWREGIKICRQKELAFGVKKSSFGVKEIKFCCEEIKFCREEIKFCREEIKICREEIKFCREEIDFCRKEVNLLP